MNKTHDSHGVLVAGKTCWRKRSAQRASFLIDGAAYFSAFVRAVEKAEKCVYIAGWDINSRVALIRDSHEAAETYRFDTFLDRMVSKSKELHIYILTWDFAMIFALERELFPLFRFGWKRDKGLHFHMDSEHPPGASHHQKIVVVDDSVAFVGGLDLTKARWDTPDHKADDLRRVDPDGRPYPPFHDVQMAVDGEAAASLGDLFRIRWERATGEILHRPELERSDAWPDDLEPDLTTIDVGIARTDPAYQGHSEVREIEALYVEAIASAQKHIYLENQYFTSSAVEKALLGKLGEPDGPEIVILLPFASSGWLEESAMDTARALLLQRLATEGRFDRLKVYYPVVPGVDPASMTFHAKVMIVDDRLVRVGSSNLSNRSMGLDTECDLAVEAMGDAGVAGTLAHLRNTLLGEHLGSGPEEVRDTLERTKSLIETIEELRDGDRTLKPLHVEVPQWLREVAPASNPADPEHPIDPDRLLRSLMPEEVEVSRKQRLFKFGAALVILLCLAVAWRWGPLAEWMSVETLSGWAAAIEKNPVAPLIVIGAFVVSGFLMVPVTLLIVATALVFGPTLGVIYSVVGSLASGVALFAVGGRIGRESVRRLAGAKVNKVSQRLARRGVLTVVALRRLPVAPYSVVNPVMGASHLSLRDFVIGTALGMTPGIVAISLLGDTLSKLVVAPQLDNLLLLLAVALLAVLVLGGLREFFMKRDADDE